MSTEHQANWYLVSPIPFLFLQSTLPLLPIFWAGVMLEKEERSKDSLPKKAWATYNCNILRIPLGYNEASQVKMLLKVGPSKVLSKR